MYELLTDRLQEMQTERESIARRLDSAEKLYELEFGRRPPGRTLQLDFLPPVPSDSRFAGLGWREAIVQVLRQTERPMHVDEIWAALREGGYQTRSRDPRRTIAAVVSRDPTAFIRFGPNQFGLGSEVDTRRGGDGRER